MFEGTNQIDHEVTQQQVFETYGKIPMSFEVNQGQTDEEVRFLSRGNGYTLFLTSNDIVLTLVNPQSGTSQDKVSSNTSEVSIIHMKLVGASYATEPKGLEKIDTKSNYFVGNDPQKWLTDIPSYAKIKYEDVYSGIDLVFYGNQQQLEYDFIVNPGADPNLIRFSFEGAEDFNIDSECNLVLELDGGKIIQKAPVIFQQNNGIKNIISGNYIIVEDKKLGINVGQYDHKLPLIIDPVLVYSTFLGGPGFEAAGSIAVDGSGNAYVIGSTNSATFPTVNPIDGTYSALTDVFISKLNPAGSALVYSTFLGGTGDDTGSDIAVDSSGNVYVTGGTDSTAFPTFNAIDSTHNGSKDVFVTKLNPAGNALVYSTFLGGAGVDQAHSIAVDSLGNAYVTGGTDITGFHYPVTPGAFNVNHNGEQDVFISKLNPAGSALVYSTFLGGTGVDTGFGIAVDSSGNVYVTGSVNEQLVSNPPPVNFPTVNAIDSSYNGDRDVFVSKLNPAGSALIYSTFLGGPGLDLGNGIAVDGSGNAYLIGSTWSPTFPTVNAIDPFHNGLQDVFISKLNPAGSALVYSTFLGGPDSEAGQDIAIDGSGNVYVTGNTSSPPFPTVNPIDGTQNGSFDVFVSKLNPAGSALVYSTFLGGQGGDTGFGIAVDGSGNAYVAGSTSSTGFPTASLDDTYNGGLTDAFVLKIGDDVVIGGTSIPIDQTALLLAGAQSISMWMIPVVIAGIGIGVFVIKRRK